MTLTGFFKGTGTNNTGATSVGTAVAEDCSAGQMVVLMIAYDNAGSGGSDPYSSISDIPGNTWTSRVAALYDPAGANAGICGRIFTTNQDVAPITTTDTVTISFGSTSVTAKAWSFFAIGPSAGNTVQFVGGNVNAGAATGTPTVTTVSIPSGDFLIGCGFAENTDSWAEDTDSTNGAWTDPGQQTGVGTGTSAVSIITQHKLVTGTGTQTYNPTRTSSDCILAWASFHENVPPPEEDFEYVNGGYYP